MAKGDDARARRQLDYQSRRGEQLGENLRTGTLEPQLRQFRDLFMQAAPQQMGDYSNTMEQLQSIMPQYQEFAKTGGFSPEGIAAIRARAIAPTRSVYAGANREVDRQRSLQGGYSPGFGTLKARMAREMSQGLSDANLNAEAALAKMVQEGRLSGLSGMGDTASRMTNLYGTTPGLTSMFGNQVLGATDQLSRGVGQEMGFGMDVARNQIEAGRMPGKWEHNIQRTKDVFDIGKKVTGVFGGYGGANA